MHQKSQILWRSRKVQKQCFGALGSRWTCFLLLFISTSWVEQALFGSSFYAWLREGQARFGVNVVPSGDFWVGSGLAYHRYTHSQWKVGYALGCHLSRHTVLFLLGTGVFPLTGRNMRKVVRCRERRL